MKTAKVASKQTKLKKGPVKKRQPASKKRPAKPTSTKAIQPLDLARFPPDSITIAEKWLCIACVLDVLTRHLKLADRTAHAQIKGYVPSLAELYAEPPARPWFVNHNQNLCPYCGSSDKWHARVVVYRIEGGRKTDALRRDLIKGLPQSENQFVVIEEKATQQHAFFEWLDRISTSLDFDGPTWLREISRHYLNRKEPKTDWATHFAQIHAIRRSRRLESGWEIAQGRLFLAAELFDELLLVQYLVSRSHKSGGLTFEGRYTLPELFSRLRNAGYLRAVDIHAQNPADALEALVAYLGGGETAIKFYHIVDRREILSKIKSLKNVTPPRPSLGRTKQSVRK